MAGRIQRLRSNLSLTGPIVATAVGIIFPIVLSTAAGIVAIAIGADTVALVIGILVVCLACAVLGSAILVTVLLGRRARMARLQADLLANVSHELRTPLAVIRMYAQTLQAGSLDAAQQRQYLETIGRETARLDVMIDQLLTWRAAARDRLAVHPRAAPLGPALRDAAERFGRLADGRGLRFDVALESSAPVEHDPQAVATMVLNLLINAYKYSGEDKRIALRASDAGDRVVVAVSDNGVGIPPEEHEKIFDSFYRGANQRYAPGAGLGLAIVAYLAQAHRARLVVDSHVGAGSTFLIELPVARPAALVR